jgi:hypothetical protein
MTRRMKHMKRDEGSSTRLKKPTRIRKGCVVHSRFSVLIGRIRLQLLILLVYRAPCGGRKRNLKVIPYLFILYFFYYRNESGMAKFNK